MTLDRFPASRQILASAISSNDARASLLLGWRTEAPNFRIELVELDAELSNHFLDLARAEAAKLAQKLTVEYDPEWILRDNQYSELSAESLPSTNLFAQLADFVNLDSFTRRNLTKPHLYVVAAQINGRVAYFGKSMTRLRVLKKTKGKFSAVWDGSTFNALTDNVATFSESFDWVYWDESLFIIDEKGFHDQFRDIHEIQIAVEGHVLAIGRKLGIVNEEKFIQRCQSNVPMASKLRRVAERGIHLTHSVDELRQYAIEWDIPVEWDGDKLVFDESLAGQWNILILLDEDRTEGPVSHRKYESASKREI
jgi:Domain of unknown function (DUF4868)